MRFAHSIRLNSNPRWWSYHVPYEQLKARLKRLRQLQDAKYFSSSPSSSQSGSSLDSRPQPDDAPPLTDLPPSSVDVDAEEEDARPGYQGSANSDDSSDDEQGSDAEEEEGDHDKGEGNDIEDPVSRPPAHGLSVGLGLSRTASDAVINTLAGLDDNPGIGPGRWGIPSTFDHKPVLPLLDIHSKASAKRQFLEEDAQFFKELKTSTQVADEFYVRMLAELRNFLNSRKRSANSLMQHRIHSTPATPLPSPISSNRANGSNEASPLLPLTRAHVQHAENGVEDDDDIGHIGNGNMLRNRNISEPQQHGKSHIHSRPPAYSHSPRSPFTQQQQRSLPTSTSNYQLDLTQRTNILWDPKKIQDLRCDFVYLYREMHNTRNFAMINMTSIEKILKKHDKMLGTSTKTKFMKYVFDTTSLRKADELANMMGEVVTLYAILYLHGDEERALTQLSYDLPELVFWTRSTYWGDGVKEKLKPAEMHKVRGFPMNDTDGVTMKQTASNAVKITSPSQLKPSVLAVGIFLFIIISLFPSVVRTLVGDKVVSAYPESVVNAANRALALLALAVVCWAGKAVPLYATSFIVFAAASSMGVFIDQQTNLPLNGHNASSIVVQHIGSPTILLILCVYAFASAMKKCEIDRVVAAAMLKRLNPTAPSLIAWVMALSIFVSALVSNVASPVLLVSVMKDTLTALYPRGKRNRKFVKCLLFAIMVSCNVGGFVSPIASPQSAIAIGVLSAAESSKIDFAQWMIIMLPLGGLMLVVVYVILMNFYFKGDVKFPLAEPPKVKFTWSHWGTIIILIATVTMWLVPIFSTVFGNTGVIATIPLFIIFGSGILGKSDFEHLAWDIIILVAGGSVLGAAIKSSHLLDMFAQRLMQYAGTTAAVSFLLLCVTTTIISVFVSHTVCSIILLPLFMRIGEQFDHPQMFVLAGTAAASIAMATNVASFPNLTISELQDEKGENYLTTKELSLGGLWMSGICLCLLASLGGGYLYFAT